MKATPLVAAACAFALAAASPTAAVITSGHSARRWLAPVPHRFVAAALCVHDGWHHSTSPPYRRTWNVPDRIYGGTGEASWHYHGHFRGGLQWTWGTWREAGGTGDPASASPAEEIYRAWRIVRKRRSWRDWPNTARACGLLR